MKPDIDIKDPRFIALNNYLVHQASLAVSATERIQQAVLPIYAVPKTKVHSRPKTKPQLLGSGVLVRIKTEYFIFTATHVLFELDGHPVMTSSGHGALLETLAGERFSTGKLSAPNANHYDASVYHIQTTISDELKKLAITEENFDLEETGGIKSLFVAIGFRIRDSQIRGNTIFTRQEAFPSFELPQEDYQKLKIQNESQFLYAHGNQVFRNDRWETSPSVRGFSGGGLVRTEGISFNINPSLAPDRDKKVRPLLTAILIEHHRGKNTLPGYILGTRINVYLGLIDQFLPHFLDDVLN